MPPPAPDAAGSAYPKAWYAAGRVVRRVPRLRPAFCVRYAADADGRAAGTAPRRHARSRDARLTAGPAPLFTVSRTRLPESAHFRRPHDRLDPIANRPHFFREE